MTDNRPTGFRLPDHSWRFYRNWLIHMLTWLLVFAALVQILRSTVSIPLFLAEGLFLYWFCTTIWSAYSTTHPRRPIRFSKLTPAEAQMGYEMVSFASRDGKTLFGYFIPGQNGATVILVHGLGAEGMSMIYHASALVAQNYSALLFDLRAHGQSAGDTGTGGWLETNDLLGALDYLQTRNDVDGDRIGVLGMSLGGQIALRAAAQDKGIRAVVAEGPNSASLADHYGETLSLWQKITRPLNWLHFVVLAFMNGARPPAGILATIQQISPRPILLIAAGRGRERQRTERFYATARPPKSFWEIPEAKHGQGYFARPEEYSAKIVSFFDQALEDNPIVNAS